MKKVIKIVLVLAILTGVLFMQSQVQASIVINSPTANNTVNNTTNTVNNTVTNNTTNTSTTNNTVNKVNNVTNTLPKTGIEDSPATIIMIIGVISAIYAYKKRIYVNSWGGKR